MRLPYASVSVSQLPVWVAQDAGLFGKQGLDVSLEYVASGTTLIQTMVAGESEFGTASSEAAIAAALAGAPLVILAPTVDRLVYNVFATTAVADAAAMRGRRLGVTRVGSSTDYAARQWLPTLGLRPDTDVTFVQLGGQPEILAGLQSGAIDAGLLSPPGNVEARRLGLRDIADLSRLDVQFYQAAVIATSRVIEGRPDLVRRFMRALVEANAVIHQDRARTKQIIGRYTQTTDEEILEDSYDATVPSIPRVPLPSRPAIEAALVLVEHSIPAAHGADPTRFYDPRFVQELEESGFIRGLYR
jgi:NitT/TauT family transport system substrate-binding protein